jgi:hypothetical protein
MIAHDPKGSAEAEQAGELAGLVGARLAEILEHGSRLAEVRAERARRRLLGRAIDIALASVAGMVLAAVALVGGLQFARGLSQGLGELTGSAWIGDLCSGVMLLGLVAGAAALALARWGPSQGKARESLELQELQAWDGLKQSVTGLGEDLVQAGRLRERVREHPYVSLGAGLAAGIAAAPLLDGLLKHAGPLARVALSGIPGIGPILRREHGPRDPTSSAR